MSQSWLFNRILRSVERGDFPTARKWLWQRVYNLLSRSWKDQDWRFMNYGYIPPGAPFPLAPQDEPERAFIGLYAQALDGLAVEGKRVLEVGCGRGGGVRYVARYHGPKAVTGLDYSAQTVVRARALNADTPGLSFEQGDAEKLPFPDASFDVVVNIESSHCYGDVAAFAREVSRVLAPGGVFTFADMRTPAMLPDLDRALAAPGLTLTAETDLTPGVVKALNAADGRKKERIGRLKLMKRFVTEFSGARGSTLYKGLTGGHVKYVARRYVRAG